MRLRAMCRISLGGREVLEGEEFDYAGDADKLAERGWAVPAKKARAPKKKKVEAKEPESADE